MRIRGSDSGSFDSGGGGSRSNSFRQGRRPGQKVRGTLLKWISEDRAWVSIDGHELLAQLHSSPRAGAQLTFIIRQLTPEIILKEVFESGAAESSTLAMASSFETARTLFENQLRHHVRALSAQPWAKRLDAFVSLLASDKPFLSAFLDATACLETLSRHIDRPPTQRLLHQPWLMPEGRRHITLLRHATAASGSSLLTETIVECELESFGMIRVEFLHRKPDTGYRLKVQQMAKAKELKHYLTTRHHPELLGTVECLGISKLPQSGHGGILAELMFTR